MFVVAVLPFTFRTERADAAADSQMVPKVDYSATYTIEPDGETMTMAHHDGIIRLEMGAAGEAIAILLEPLAHRAIMLMQGMAIELDTRQGSPGISAKPGVGPGDVLGGSRIDPTPLGSKTIAGLTCVVYDAICNAGGEEVHSRVCLTPDNVMLESVSTDPGKPFTMTATQVSIAPQDPARFSPPAGVQVMSMDQMMQGMGECPVCRSGEGTGTRPGDLSPRGGRGSIGARSGGSAMSRLATLAATTALCALAALPAAADPLPLPKVDYAATYTVTPGGQTMQLAHHQGLMRMDMTERGQPMTGFMNLHTNRMFVLLQSPMLMAFEMDMSQPIPGAPGAAGGMSPQKMMTEADVTLTRIGTRTIAGVGCTFYDAIGTLGKDRVDAKVCLTPDNVLLYSETVDQGKTYVVTATRVSLTPQDPGRFQVPAGVPIMPAEQMMQGLGGIGGLGGLRIPGLN
ncbi:hypothetical protein D3874_03920 [Oleomonas cavernae]|uniref:DUF4412 domain-containing protein n=1 Tax=Oleomonas cavernae TaxID=2320859 RepID=A0A418W8G9_9PROT|nr:hypothetical protein D3874_03920 [Oleomonas cavernae]